MLFPSHPEILEFNKREFYNSTIRTCTLLFKKNSEILTIFNNEKFDFILTKNVSKYLFLKQFLVNYSTKKETVLANFNKSKFIPV